MKNVHLHREISTLSFNERVLQEAEDSRNPLMERLKFLGIFSSNMDEFFKVRVASIQRRLELGKKSMAEVLDIINEKTLDLDERFRAAYAEITAGLERVGIKIITEDDIPSLAPPIEQWLADYFRGQVLPSLVPIMVSRTNKFPQITDGVLYFAVSMSGDKSRYAILELPAELARFVELPNGNIMYVDDVIRYFLSDVFYIFPFTKIEAFEFKISRDAELDIDNDFSEGYVEKMERVLRQRDGGQPTRLVYDARMPKKLLEVLIDQLRIDKTDTLIGGGRYHNMKDLIRFPNKRPDLSFESVEPLPHYILDSERKPILDAVKKRDVLITYPYQSFDLLIRLMREAAIDPSVTAISMTLYRSAKKSQVVNALINAVRNGKKVFVNVELQARFDEENNISISEKLQAAGASVAYGVPPMKTHCKLLLIEARDRVVAGLSTGNFNESTGRLYVDSLLLTADPRLTKDVAKVFDFLTKTSKNRLVKPPKFHDLLVSPFNARNVFLKELAKEEAKGADGYVLLKVNHLTDPKFIKRLREAADAGVQMDFIVRTTYAMRSHKNVRAISILDRYLEHQRCYIFGRGDARRVYLGSADLMERNMDWRIEAAFPVYDEALKLQVAKMMEIQVSDTYKARILDDSQSNPYAADGPEPIRAQVETYKYIKRLSEAGDSRKK